MGRTVTPLDTPVAPPAHVWANIQAELGLSIADPSTQPRDPEPGSVVPLRRGSSEAPPTVVAEVGLEGTEGRLPIPASVDLDDYAVVDVSAEPLDGDPTHSGDSIVRGILGT